MEPNQTLRNAMQAVRDVSDNDLDAMLQIDDHSLSLQSTVPHSNNVTSMIRKDTQSIMDFNREPFPSQIDSQQSGFDGNASFNIPNLSNISEDFFNLTSSNSIEVISSPSPDLIVLNNSDASTINEYKTKNSLIEFKKLPSSRSSIPSKEHSTLDIFPEERTNNNTVLNASFVEEFAKYKDTDFDLDIDFDLINEQECAHRLREYSQSQPRVNQSNQLEQSSSHFNRNASRDVMHFSPAPNVKEEILDLFSEQESQKNNHVDASFVKEFGNFKDTDFDLPILDADLQIISELERPHTQIDKSKKICISQSKTQIKPNSVPTILDNGPVSCPIPERSKLCSQLENFEQSLESSPNPKDYLVLTYTQSSANSTEQGGENKMLSTSEPLDYSRQSKNKNRKKKDSQNVSEQVRNSCDSPMENDNLNYMHMANISIADATSIPSSVKQLYDVIKTEYSDFAFVYALSAQLCQDRVPMDCFVNLKLGLLLSLASIESNPDRSPIPIIAIGDDSSIINYLMMNVGQLAGRFIGPTDDVKPPSMAGNKSYTWIEADPIILAKGGVFYIGDWSRLKTARADKLFKEIECSRITIQKSTLVYPLEAAVWSHWRSFRDNSKDQQAFNNFVKVFGIPVIADDTNYEVLVNYILEQSSVQLFESTVDHLSISTEDMRDFLSIISRRTVDLSSEASLLLQKYFVASRTERPDCLSKQAFVVLKQFSESFAKLSFRHEVLAIDAVAAIFMCESFVQHIFGANENPPPKFESHNYIGNVDAHIFEFQKWLLKYIERYYKKP